MPFFTVLMFNDPPTFQFGGRPYFIYPRRTRANLRSRVGNEQTEEPKAFQATCFYNAIQVLWPEDFENSHDRPMINILRFEREDPNNSDRCRIYKWLDSGARFCVTLRDDEENIPRVV